MWREMIQNICTECSLWPPALDSSIIQIEEALGLTVPEDLRSLWLETDGVQDRYGDGIWSTNKLIQQNLDLRAYPEQNDLYMSFEPLFCFADAGNGDLFFFPIQADGEIHRNDVFVWNHETDSRKWIAPSLSRFVEEWFQGLIRV